MSIFKLTENGKCDVIVTFFNKSNSIVAQRSLTFDVKPTLKEIKERYKTFKKDYDAVLMRITLTPSCEVKFLKL
jgi:hypothetical protein